MAAVVFIPRCICARQICFPGVKVARDVRPLLVLLGAYVVSDIIMEGVILLERVPCWRAQLLEKIVGGIGRPETEQSMGYLPAAKSLQFSSVEILSICLKERAADMCRHPVLLQSPPWLPLAYYYYKAVRRSPDCLQMMH